MYWSSTSDAVYRIFPLHTCFMQCLLPEIQTVWDWDTICQYSCPRNHMTPSLTFTIPIQDPYCINLYETGFVFHFLCAILLEGFDLKPLELLVEKSCVHCKCKRRHAHKTASINYHLKCLRKWRVVTCIYILLNNFSLPLLTSFLIK